jgi:hypothetical protein
MKTATPRSAVPGFRSTGIYVLPETTVTPSSVSEGPLRCNVYRGQITASGTVCDSWRSRNLSLDVSRNNVFSRKMSKADNLRLSVNMNMISWLKISFGVSHGKGQIWALRRLKLRKESKGRRKETWTNLWGLWWLLFRLSNKWQLDSVHGVKCMFLRKMWKWEGCEHRALGDEVCALLTSDSS